MSDVKLHSEGAKIKLNQQDSSLAIIKTGGKQIKVMVGQHIWIDRTPLPVKSEIVFDQVLMVNDHFGRPFLPNARVSGEVVKVNKAKKIVVFKYKPKKGYHKKQGHRQWQTKVLITSIMLDGGEEKSRPAPDQTTVPVLKAS